MDFVMILYLLTYILEPFVFGINIIIVFAKNKNLNGYFRQDAVSRDRYANNNYRALWNLIFIKKGGYKFGDERETISSCLGKNQEAGTLTKIGLAFCKFLNIFEKDHCKKSIINF
jgi:hypothetical protein